MGVRYLKEELCNGCGLCVEDCPTDVFVMDEATNKARVAYAEDCWECILCEKICPTRAIEIDPAAARKLFFPF